jgi:hypothetical protein
LAIIGFFIYKIMEHNQAEKERLQKLLEKNKTEAKPNAPQQIPSHLFNMQ